MKKRILAAVTYSAAMLATMACTVPRKPMTVAQLIAANPELSRVASLIEQTDLAESFRNPGSLTIFAPTNDVFRALPPAVVGSLMNDPARLKALLTYHVVPGLLMTVDLSIGRVKTMQGGELSLSRAGMFVTADEAVITTFDAQASNGVIHTVDKVMMPAC